VLVANRRCELWQKKNKHVGSQLDPSWIPVVTQCDRNFPNKAASPDYLTLTFCPGLLPPSP